MSSKAKWAVYIALAVLAVILIVFLAVRMAGIVKPDRQAGSAASAYLSVLTRGKPFRSAGEEIRSLEDYCAGNGARITGFYYLDMTGDSRPELVLALESGTGGGWLVLTYSGEIDVVLGYTLPYRAMTDIKEDGTFIWAESADVTGVGRLSLSEFDYSITRLAITIPVQSVKTDAALHPFSAKSIEEVIG